MAFNSCFRIFLDCYECLGFFLSGIHRIWVDAWGLCTCAGCFCSKNPWHFSGGFRIKHFSMCCRIFRALPECMGCFLAGVPSISVDALSFTRWLGILVLGIPDVSVDASGISLFDYWVHFSSLVHLRAFCFIISFWSLSMFVDTYQFLFVDMATRELLSESSCLPSPVAAKHANEMALAARSLWNTEQSSCATKQQAPTSECNISA